MAWVGVESDQPTLKARTAIWSQSGRIHRRRRSGSCGCGHDARLLAVGDLNDGHFGRGTRQEVVQHENQHGRVLGSARLRGTARQRPDWQSRCRYPPAGYPLQGTTTRRPIRKSAPEATNLAAPSCGPHGGIQRRCRTSLQHARLLMAWCILVRTILQRWIERR